MADNSPQAPPCMPEDTHPSSTSSTDDEYTDESGEEDETLSEKLRANEVPSGFEKTPHSFIPQGIINKLITRESILEAMKIGPDTSCYDSLIDFVELKAMKVFAILVYINLDLLKEAMLLFQKGAFHDEHLPVESSPSTTQDSLSSVVGSRRVLKVGSTKITPRSVWSKGKIQDFRKHQWMFLAPVFSTAKSDHDLGDHIIPFTWKGRSSAEGAFGKVSQYRVHPDHIEDPSRLSDDCPTYFAVKEIKNESSGDNHKVDAEVKALMMMNTLNQAHIVRFITAFRRCKKDDYEHYIMFEWADGGNLHDLWKATPSPELSPPFLKAVVKQLYGLAQALQAAHDLRDGASYRHGDLKPANILWFKEGGLVGTLKIGDWGEAKGHNISTEFRLNQTKARFSTRRYEAPEVDTGLAPVTAGQSSKRRSRLYDIWAMGCITLEFLVWLLYGSSGLKRFNRSVRTDLNGDSPFYEASVEQGKRVVNVHKAIVLWMDHMAQDPACRVGTTALGDLLEIVRTGLLVVKLPRRTGSYQKSSTKQLRQQPSSKLLTMAVPSESVNLPSLSSSASSQQALSNFIPAIEATPAETNESSALLAQPEPEPDKTVRYLASEMYTRLDHIVSENDNDSYWCVETSTRTPPVDFGGSVPTHVSSSSDSNPTDDSSNSISKKVNQAASQGLAAPMSWRDLDPHDWETHVDNVFASTVFSTLLGQTPFQVSEIPVSSRLCDKCFDFRDRIWQSEFSTTYSVPNLKASAKLGQCDLCRLLWRTCERNQGTAFPTVRFDRDVGTGSEPCSSLSMNCGVPVLSIFRNFNLEAPAARNLQIGFAKLPEVGSLAHFEIIRQWLLDCDKMHSTSTCQLAQQGQTSTPRLPTRLIDVGNVGDGQVRLWETGPNDTGEWIALSHQWGVVPHFSTHRLNVDDHIAGIRFEKLPDTFKDAVKVTRALGLRYLWIDSVCIIQGDDGDFKHEAKRMEEVYSGAYCVLAASRATGHYSGFLQARNGRDYVALRRDVANEAPFYICQPIDNFKEHVLEGDLNRRGWVLQEHALARRTIFFTEHQTYWECGHGVRCETMTRMTNNSAALLGDPNFPQILIVARHGERILRFQELYCRYSRLGLAKPFDRPTAIDSLQQRTLRTMNVRGGFGVFEEGATMGLLRRSLLWHRGHDTTSLTRIDFPADRIPSWSWMAYTGGIDYLDMVFGDNTWEDMSSPWSRPGAQEGDTILTGRVREYHQHLATQGEDLIILDNPETVALEKTTCVVLGIQKGAVPLEDRRHYLMIVTPTTTDGDTQGNLYERIGVGYMPGRCIEDDGVTIKIV